MGIPRRPMRPEDSRVPSDTIARLPPAQYCFSQADHDELHRWSAATARQGYFILENTDPRTGAPKWVAQGQDGAEYVSVARDHIGTSATLTVRQSSGGWETRRNGDRLVNVSASLRSALEAVCATPQGSLGAHS